MNNPPKSIAIRLNAPFWFFQLQLCREFKKRFNSRITLYVGNSFDKKYLAETLEKEFYDDVIVYNPRVQTYKKHIDEKAVYEQATNWEDFLNCTFNELIMADRLLGRGFSLGGYNHTRSALCEKQDHPRVVDLYNQELTFWKKEIEDKSIDLFIEAHKVLFVLCRAMKISACMLQPASHENYYYWSFEEYGINKDFEKVFDEFKTQEFPPVIKERGPVNDAVFRANYFKESGLRALVKDITIYSLHRLIAILKKDESAHSMTLLSRFRRLWLRYSDGKKLLSPKYGKSFESFKDKDFFYFPLLTEPETTLQVQSPEFFSQLWCIALIAKTLPARFHLVTKEHIYPIGARPANFYDQILEFKNVILSHVSITGLNIIKRSKATITINGSSGFEAAMLGVPTIVLAKRCAYAFLDHVFHCPLGEGLQDAIQNIAKNKVDLEKAKKDGARLEKTIVACCFSLENFAPKGNMRKQVDPQMVERAVEHFIKARNAL